MSSNFQRLGTTPKQRQAQQLTFSVRMICDIASEYDTVVDRGDMLCAYSMIDSFHVNIRLLAEFLARRTSAKDFGPTDFVAGWKPPSTEAVRRLGEAWEMASAYVVHLSSRRVPDSLDDLTTFEVSGSGLRSLSADALEVYAEFVTLVAESAPPWSQGARIPDPETEPDAWAARVESDVVETLKAALDDGRASLAR